mmetsp:Transcript_49413/g.97347  ORF Transcript_49413/g.97347 Transcript_49413/m.97347 type:complete len:99 (+) Transcript_49413:36-332(+)
MQSASECDFENDALLSGDETGFLPSMSRIEKTLSQSLIEESLSFFRGLLCKRANDEEIPESRQWVKYETADVHRNFVVCSDLTVRSFVRGVWMSPCGC